jgi:hypothetical protein
MISKDCHCLIALLAGWVLRSPPRSRKSVQEGLSSSSPLPQEMSSSVALPDGTCDRRSESTSFVDPRDELKENYEDPLPGRDEDSIGGVGCRLDSSRSVQIETDDGVEAAAEVVALKQRVLELRAQVAACKAQIRRGDDLRQEATSAMLPVPLEASDRRVELRQSDEHAELRRLSDVRPQREKSSDAGLPLLKAPQASTQGPTTGEGALLQAAQLEEMEEVGKLAMAETHGSTLVRREELEWSGGEGEVLSTVHSSEFDLHDLHSSASVARPAEDECTESHECMQGSPARVEIRPEESHPGSEQSDSSSSLPGKSVSRVSAALSNSSCGIRRRKGRLGLLEVSLDNSPGLQLEKTPQLRAPFGREVADGAQGGGAIRRLKQSIQDGSFLALPATLSLHGTQAESSDFAEGPVHRREVLPTNSPEAWQ